MSLFQSTRPIRGATDDDGKNASNKVYFNPRAPYGARQAEDSIYRVLMQFQSTRPIRGATASARNCSPNHSISIHAPHTGRDGSMDYDERERRDFNPRAPYGARQGDEKCPSVKSL